MSRYMLTAKGLRYFQLINPASSLTATGEAATSASLSFICLHLYHLWVVDNPSYWSGWLCLLFAKLCVAIIFCQIILKKLFHTLWLSIPKENPLGSLILQACSLAILFIPQIPSFWPCYGHVYTASTIHDISSNCTKSLVCKSSMDFPPWDKWLSWI